MCAANLPADDRTAVGVDHEREGDDALPAAQVGEVGEPELVGAAGCEVALDEIGRPIGIRVREGRPPRLPAPFRALDAVCAHQPLNSAAADLLAGAQERLPHPPGAVREVVAPVQLADQLEQPVVLDLARGPLPGRTPVIRRRRHAQGPANRLDPEALALLIDEHAHLGRCGSSSPAKTTDAAFRISFVRRSSNTSRRSSRISSRSALVGRSGRRPSSASTWRTYLRSVSDGNPRSAATCAIGRPDSNTSRAARSKSSTGYFLALGMTDLSFRQADPGIEVSVKTGMAQTIVRSLARASCARGIPTDTNPFLRLR